MATGSVNSISQLLNDGRGEGAIAVLALDAQAAAQAVSECIRTTLRYDRDLDRRDTFLAYTIMAKGLPVRVLLDPVIALERDRGGMKRGGCAFEARKALVALASVGYAGTREALITYLAESEFWPRVVTLLACLPRDDWIDVLRSATPSVAAHPVQLRELEDLDLTLPTWRYLLQTHVGVDALAAYDAAQVDEPRYVPRRRAPTDADAAPPPEITAVAGKLRENAERVSDGEIVRSSRLIRRHAKHLFTHEDALRLLTSERDIVCRIGAAALVGRLRGSAHDALSAATGKAIRTHDWRTLCGYGDVWASTRSDRGYEELRRIHASMAYTYGRALMVEALLSNYGRTVDTAFLETQLFDCQYRARAAAISALRERDGISERALSRIELLSASPFEGEGCYLTLLNRLEAGRP